MSTNSSTPKISVKQSGSQGPRGFQGWTPNIVQVPDGNRLVNFLQSYVGGTGPLPVALTNLVGKYQKADGTWTADIAQAFDINSGSAANAALATTRSNSAQAFAANAGTMAANAAGSANTASTKADEAFTSAANAATANTNAQTAKTAAETAATTATTKAAEAVASATNAAASAATSSAVALGVSTGRNSIAPSILLDFANTQQLDSRLVFTRGSTATYFDRTGVLRTAPANVARFNFDPETGESLGLLIESSSTNLAINSFLPQNWISTPNIISVNSNIENIFGDSKARSFRGSGNSANCYFNLNQNFSYAANTKYTISIYAKIISGAAPSNGNIISAMYSGSAGEITTRANVALSNLTTSWKRYSVTFTNVDAGNYPLFFHADTSNSTCEVAYSCPQVEQNSSATSFIPTSGSSITRSADFCSFSSNLANLINRSEGTFFAIFQKPTVPFFNRIIGTNSIIDYLFVGNNNNQVFSTDGIVSMSAQSLNPQEKFSKACISWKNGGTKRISVDNSVVVSSASAFGEPNIIYVGFGGTLHLNGTIKKIAYYPKQLSDTEIRELTSVKLAGESSNQVPSAGDLGGAAFMQLRSLVAMKARSEVNYHGTGTQVSYTIRRPYAFILGVVNSNGSTTTTLPTANADGTYTADTNYTLLHNAPVGTALTLEIIPVLY